MLVVEVRALCGRADLVTLGPIALDGTQAQASRSNTMNYGRMATEDAQLAVEVQPLLGHEA
jgi:hypothetical protein